MKKILVIAMIVLFSKNSSAYDYTGKIGVGGGLGYSQPALNNAFHDFANADMAYDIWLRYHLDASWGLELSYNKSEFDNTTLGIENIRLLANYRFDAIKKGTFIAGLGAGVASSDDTQEALDNEFSLYARAGYDYSFWPCLVGGVYLDYQFTDNSDFAGDIHIITPKVGLTYYFGAYGSPKKEAATAIKEVVQQNLDTDNDGVNDSNDKCPNTPADTDVNEYGCAKEEKAQIKLNVEFSSGKTDIAVQYESELETFANFMKKHKDTTAQIEGHTDNTGSEKINTLLSQKRAESVRAYLINKLGISESRLTAKGFGPSQPVADNKTTSGRKQNRRVVAVVSSK